MSQLRPTFFFASLAIIICGVIAWPVFAGPVTNPTSPPSAPFVKLGVYQGVVSVVSGSNALEIGNAGRDIAASGDIYLLPGGHLYPSGVRIKKSDVFAEAAIDVGNGQICLNTDQAGTYSCISSWASGSTGDTYWSLAGSALSPKVTSPVVDVIRIGTDAKPVPAAYGRALDIYSASAAPAVNVVGVLETGYYDGSSYRGGNIRVAGQVKASNSATSGNPQYSLGGSGLAPWSSRDVFNATTFVGSGIDADTFDGNATVLFPTDHNFFWKTVTGGNALCIKTTASKLCTGGTNAGADCSNNAAVCQGGGTCTNMCQVQDLTCVADSTTKHCESGSGPYTPAQACNTNLDCNAGIDFCVRGQLKIVTSGSTSGCSGSLSCAQICAGAYMARCDGTVGGPVSCSSYGSAVTANNGVSAGSCLPPASPGFSYRVPCDCFLDTNTPYLQNVASGGQAHLCTPKTSALNLN